MAELVPIIRAPGEGDHQAFLGGGSHTWKLLNGDTDGAFFLLEDVMEQGKCTPLHCHPEADETTYLIEGELLVNVDGQETRVTAGSVMFNPKGTPHAFLVVSETARLISFQTPGVGEAFYRDASEPETDATVGAVDIARLQASAQANPRGVQLLGPPPFATATAGA